MERRPRNVETITLCVRRGGSSEVRRLELCGHRLLAGHADTGIFRIVASARPRAAPGPATPAGHLRREDDDGLATATIEIAEPLALVEPSGRGDPFNRGGGTTR